MLADCCFSPSRWQEGAPKDAPIAHDLRMRAKLPETILLATVRIKALAQGRDAWSQLSTGPHYFAA